MGLDMSAYRTKYQPQQEVDFEKEVFSEEVGENQNELIAQWRKHPNLHGWMQNLYEKKGGCDPDFNCNCVALTAEDLDKLALDLINGDLPHTEGFFFGVSKGSEEEREDDLAFVKSAHEAIKEGYTVFYTSWW